MSIPFSGIVQAGLQLGLDTVVIRPKRGIFAITKSDGETLPDIIAQAVVEERHQDELEVTDHPVEVGAMIADHAYKRPATVTLTLGWSNSPSSRGGLISPLVGGAVAFGGRAVANVVGAVEAGIGAAGIQSAMNGANVDQIKQLYQKLLNLQQSRALFTLLTGKREYKNMICRSLATESDFRTENSLPITMVCQELILVRTSVVQLPAETQANPEETASRQERGVVPVKSIDSRPDFKA